MYGESRVYGLKCQARCIVAQAAEKERSCFLVGTLGVREENEVHLVHCSEFGTDLLCEGVYAHQHEIWDLAACPFDPLIFSTVYRAGGDHNAAIWQIPEGRTATHGSSLNQLVELSGHNARIKCVLWYPGSKLDAVITLDEEKLRLWDLNTGQKSAAVRASASGGELQQMSCGSWSPHDSTRVASASDTTVNLWDTRSMKHTHTIDQAHAMQVRDVDFNPRKEEYMMTAGDDSRIRFWDVRSLKSHVLEIVAHSHWAWRARYNPVYDQLVLSSGTDAAVNLWHVPRMAQEGGAEGSSGPRSLDHGVASRRSVTDSPRGHHDALVQSFNEHEDSVYGIAWSVHDPWVFAALSYDGRVMVDFVPQGTRGLVDRHAARPTRRSTREHVQGISLAV